MAFYSNVTLEKPYTWVKFKEGMCETCVGSCCKTQTDVDLEDLIRMGILTDFHREEPIRKTAKQLKKEGIVKLFNLKKEVFTLNQKDNGECIYFDDEIRRCTVYEVRPQASRDHPKIGANPGNCAFIDKDAPEKG